jgi:hypothetical protein
LIRHSAVVVVVALLTGISLTTMICAAEVVFEGVKDGQIGSEVRFRLEGEILEGDSDRVANALLDAEISSLDDPWRRIVIALDSQGGAFHEGINLATSFRRLGIATVVRAEDACYSACAIAFLGGVDLPKDPNPVSAGEPLPNQKPSRSLEKGARLGFHAPYLSVPEGDYDAGLVQDAYRAAVLGIARLIAVADQIYIVPAELPKLLAPDRDEMYMADDVDAVGFLGIEYADYSYQIRENYGFTQSMILNGCVNRYYHLQRRSSVDGFAVALSAFNEFVEGSQLMENGEDAIAFGVRSMMQGSAPTWLAYMPVGKTEDGARFVWCLFSPGVGSPTTFYKPGGTIEELFSELGEKNDLWTYTSSPTTIQLSTGDWIDDMMRALDLVPPQTKLVDVVRQLEVYQSTEAVVAAE